MWSFHLKNMFSPEKLTLTWIVSVLYVRAVLEVCSSCRWGWCPMWTLKLARYRRQCMQAESTVGMVRKIKHDKCKEIPWFGNNTALWKYETENGRNEALEGIEIEWIKKSIVCHFQSLGPALCFLGITKEFWTEERCVHVHILEASLS